MANVPLGLTLAFGAVAVVLLGVGAMAYFGQRWAFNPPTPRFLRRVGAVTAMFGAFEVVFSVVAAFATANAGPGLILNLAQGLVLLVVGWNMSRATKVAT